MTAPRTAQKRRKPVSAPPEPSIPPMEEEPGWATADMLSDEVMFEDVTLYNGKKVRVRYLDTLEVTALQLLPDYAGYLALVVRLREAIEKGLTDEDQPILNEDFDTDKASLDTVKYQVHIAHRAIVDRLHSGDVMCEDCKESHPRSLWTRKEVARLPGTEIERVAAIALRAGEVVARRPFLRDKTQNDSSPPVSTGDSTQPTSS